MPAELVVDDVWALYRQDPLRLWWVRTRPSDAQFARFVDAWANDLDSRDEAIGLGVLFDVVELSLSASQRARLAEVQQQRRVRITRTTRAFALASPSRLTRGMLTAVYWLWPPPYPYRVVADGRQGLGFLAEAVRFDLPARAAEWDDVKSRVAQQWER
jgi:hypothetical protein